MDDITKLSGPELADIIDALAAGYDRLSVMPGRTSAEGHMLHEAARRMREDTRVWQRNLERERDGLRDRVRDLECELAQCKETMRGMHEARGELQRELDELRAERGCTATWAAAMTKNELVDEIERWRGNLHECKVLHRLTKQERDAYLQECNTLRNQLTDATRDLRWQTDECERLRLSGISDDDSYDPYKRLCDIVDEECGMQEAKLPVGTLLSMLENAFFDWRKRAVNAERDLKEQLDGNMEHRKQYGARDDETMGQWLSRVHGRVAELERSQRSCERHQFESGGAIAGIDELGCYQVASDGMRHDAYPSYVLSVAAARVADLEGSMVSMQHNAERRLKRVKELEAQHVDMDKPLSETAEALVLAWSTLDAASALADRWETPGETSSTKMRGAAAQLREVLNGKR